MRQSVVRRVICMTIIPLSLKTANAFIVAHHRHHKVVQGHKFSLGLLDGSNALVAVCVVGRPVARRLDDGFTAEVTRLCSDGSKNACSKLYSAASRVAREMGYRRILTYTLESEPGTSLVATGWTKTVTTPGKSWSVPSRPRVDKHVLSIRFRWEKVLI